MSTSTTRPSPHRAALIALGAACATAMTFLGCSQPEVGRLPAGKKPPNIVLIMIDTLRADRLAAYGGTRDLTPTLDAISAEGVTFERAIAQAPWTQPSIASLFCSYNPGVHKVLSYSDAFRGATDQAPKLTVFDDAFTTLPELLQQYGYETAAFSANPFIVPDYGFGQGFDHFDASFAKNTTPGNVVTDAAVAWLKERKSDKPLFLYLHYMDVHGPYRGDAEYLEARISEIEKLPNKRTLDALEVEALNYLRKPPPDPNTTPRHEPLMRYREYWVARYDAGVREVDKQVAALRERLTELSLWNDAFVIVTADHGEALCEHGFWEHGFSVHHNQLHVPLILRWPGVLPPGQRIATTARLIDLMPTLLDQLRLPPVEGVQGVSLVPHWQTKPPKAVPDAFAECTKVGVEQKAYYRGNLKLILVQTEPPRPFLYDIATDPDEQKPLSGGPHADRLRGLYDALARQLKENEATRPPTEAQTTALSAEEERRLRAIGYLGDSTPPQAASQPATRGASQPITTQPAPPSGPKADEGGSGDEE